MGPALLSATLGLAVSARPELVLMVTPTVGTQDRKHLAGPCLPAKALCSGGNVLVCQPRPGERGCLGLLRSCCPQLQERLGCHK